MSFIKKTTKKESGQMMILLVIVISVVALSAMALSSFLVVSQLKQVTDARFSGAALFAADEGVECVLMHEFNNNNYGSTQCPSYPETIDDCTGSWSAKRNIPGGGSYQFRCTDKQVSAGGEDKYFLAVGADKPANERVTRALQIRLHKI